MFDGAIHSDQVKNVRHDKKCEWQQSYCEETIGHVEIVLKSIIVAFASANRLARCVEHGFGAKNVDNVIAHNARRV